MLKIRQLPTFNAVASTVASGARNTVTVRLNNGERVHALYLEFGNDGATNPGQGIGTLAAPGMIGEIRLKLDGKVQRSFTAQELNALNTLMGAQFAAGTSGTAGVAGYRTRLPIFLAEVWRRGFVQLKNGISLPEAELSAWNLVDVNATLEVDIEGRLSTGANGEVSGPVIGGFYEYDEPVGQIGQIVKWRRQNFGVSSSPAEISTLDRKAGSYQSLHMFATSDGKYVNSLMFTRNSQQIRQDVTRFQNDLILKTRDMNPVALDTTSATTKTNTGLYNLVFDYDDPIRNELAVDGANELTLKPSFDAAPSGGMIVISQVTGQPD